MLPPETMQTTLPVPPWPARAAARRERAGALGDDAGALGEQAHGGCRLVERDGDGAVDELLREAPHLRQQRAAARAVDERGACSRPRSDSPAGSEAVSGAPVSGSTAITRVPGLAAA